MKAKISDLRPHPDNPRRGDVDAIAESIRTNGQYRPIVVQTKTNYVLAGNHTLAAMKKLRRKTIEVVYADVDAKTAKRILLVDNRTADLATYDDRALLELLHELSASDQALDGTGFDQEALDDLEFVLAKRTPQESQLYSERQLRAIVLPYDGQEYAKVTGFIKALRERRGIETNADLVATLVREASE